jgi:hypothetical protein
MIERIPIETLRAFCSSREIDLTLVSPPQGYVVAFHGEYDGYGDFFTIAMRGVEYLDVAGGITIGDLVLASQVREVGELALKWRGLGRRYSGSALAMRSAEADAWGTASQDGMYLVVASEIVIMPGEDWK